MSHFYGNHGTSAYDMKKYMRVRMRNDTMKPPHTFTEDITITNNNGNISIKASQMKDGITQIVQSNTVPPQNEPQTLEETYEATPPPQTARKAKQEYMPINTESQDKMWSLEYNVVSNELYLVPNNKIASNYILTDITDEFREDLFPLIVPTKNIVNSRTGLNVGQELLIDIKSKTIHWRKDVNVILAYNPVQGLFSRLWGKITGNAFVPSLELVTENKAIDDGYMYKWGI